MRVIVSRVLAILRMIVGMIVRAVITVRVIVSRVLAILRMIVAVAPVGAGFDGGHYAALQHSSV